MNMEHRAIGQEEETEVIMTGESATEAYKKLLEMAENAANAKKTRFEVITESPASLADFLIDVRCNVGHYKYNEYPPADDYEEMERWLNEECEWK